MEVHGGGQKGVMLITPLSQLNINVLHLDEGYRKKISL